MSKSQDPDHFFQTSQSLAETSRKAAKSHNEHGAPIRLKSKILAVVADPTREGTVYLAESAGQVRRLVLDTGDSIQLYRGPTAPLTSLAISPDNSILFAGCWDKTIWSWSIASPTITKRCYRGHTDFVKAVLCSRLLRPYNISQPFDILISGSADSTIVIWNVLDGSKLQTLVGHSRGILCLAIDPLPQFDERSECGDDENGLITLFSGSSDREIRRWTLPSDICAPSSSGTRRNLLSEEPPIVSHETNVYALQFDKDDDLWTASADGTAKCLSRANQWEVDTVLQHGDFVRAVAVDETVGYVMTAGRDEDVKIWDKTSGKFVFGYQGHYDEITGLVCLKGSIVVSVGIDGTIRRWSLKAEDIGRARKEREDEEKGIEKEAKALEDKGSLVTEDEEKELAELMDDGE